MSSNIRILKEDNVNLLRRRCLSGIPFVLAMSAFLCSYISNFGCTNIEFIPQEENHASTNDFFRPRSISFGLWMYQSQRMTTVQNGEIIYTEFCTGYDNRSIYMDSSWKAARAVSILSIVIAGFLLLWQFAAPFLLFDLNYWRIAMILFTLLSIIQGCTLFFLQSSACFDNALIYTLAYNPIIYPTHCSWDTRSTRTSIVSAVLYAVTAISMIIIPAPGIRPRERPYPMMVWDANTIGGGKKSDDDDDDDDDNDSTSSFAYDTEIDKDDDFYQHNRNKMSTWREQQDVTDTSYSSNSQNDNADDDVAYVQKGMGV